METSDKRREIAEEARHRLEGTLVSVKKRLHPRALSRELIDTAKQKARSAADDAVDAVKSRPAIIASLTAAAAVYFLRKPLKSALKQILKEKKNG
jgi:ElaB/YqjD/DUF883 family membrane-anchored ribosome-binding protein